MKSRRGTFWSPRARGFSLVEALAGSLLLGSLLVAMLVAMSRMEMQSRRAEDQVQACAVLDGLLEEWWQDRDNFPDGDSGEVPDHAGWWWRTRGVANPDARILHGRVIAVEVFSPQTGDSLPAARTEVLLPAVTETNASGAK